MAGKLYIGSDAATYAYLGEQCVYELVTGPKDITVTFNFTSTVTAPIYIYSGTTQLAQLSSAPYTFTGHTGDKITWRTSKFVDGVQYRAFGSITLLNDVTQNVNMLPFYRVTFNWIEPTSSYTGYHYASIVGYYGGQEWEEYGTTEYSQGTIVEYMAGADGYYSVNSSYGPITGHTAIPIQLQSTNTGYTVQYLTFEVLSAGTIGWDAASAGKTISISVNNGTWTTKTASNGGTLGTFSVGDKIRLKGTNSTYYGSCFEGGTALYDVYGNISSLIYGDNFTGQTTPTVDAGGFRNLFGYSRVVSAENMIMPFTSLPASACSGMFESSFYLTKAPHLTATSVGNNAYDSMFEYCTKLATPPGIEAESIGVSACTRMFNRCYSLTGTSEFKATTLGNGCYSSMYMSCSGLTSVESLSATALTNSCYEHMFAWCTSLTTPPALPATTLASRCYLGMFKGCSSLTTTPTLAATIMAHGCYGEMFAGCTSLTTPPSLPATTLAEVCYGSMFSGCTSLSTATTLSVTALTESCYSAMFAGCTSLATAPSLPATTLANYCYQGMFDGCTNLTTAPTLNAPTLVEGCYMEMFKNCNSLTSIRVLATNGIDTNDSTYEWVSGITTTGTLYVAQGMTNAWLPRGANKCPINWAVDGGVLNVTLTITANQANSTVYISTDGGSTWPQRSTVTVPAGTTVQYKLSNSSLGDAGCVGIAKSYTVNATTSITDDVYVQYTVSVAPTATTFHSSYEAQDIFVSSSLTTYQGVNYKTMTIATPYKATNSLYFTHPNFTSGINFYGPFDNIGDRNWGYKIMQAKVTFSVTPSDASITVSTGVSSSSMSSPYQPAQNYLNLAYGYYLAWVISKNGYQQQQGTTFQITGDTTITANLQTTLISFYISASDGGNLENQTSYEITAGNAYVSLYQGPYQPVAKYDAYQFAWNDNYGFTIKISANGYQDYTYVMPAGDPGVSFISIVLSPASTHYQLTVNLQSEDAEPISMPITANYTYNGAASSTTATGSALVIQADQNTTVSYTIKGNGFRQVTNSFTIAGNTTRNETIYPYYLERPLTIRNNGSSNATITIQTNDRSNIAGDISVNIKSSYTGSSESYTNIQASSQTITIAAGKMAEIYTTNNKYKPTYSRYIKISGTGNLVAEGNVASLLSGTSVSNLVASSNITPPAYAFTNLFNGCTGLTSVEHLRLPFKTASSNCYSYMFYGCTNISGETAAMNATSVDTYSCYYMYYNCYGITTAAILATSLSSYCFERMFQNCSSLASIFYAPSSAPSTTNNRYWVSGVSSSGTFNTSGNWNPNPSSGYGVSGVPKSTTNKWTFNNNQFKPSMDI